MGGWAVAQSPILVTTITLDRLRERGYEAMLELYEKIAPHLNEPLYTRPVREFVPIFIGSGVRGSPCQLITGRAVYSIMGRFSLSSHWIYLYLSTNSS